MTKSPSHLPRAACHGLAAILLAAAPLFAQGGNLLTNSGFAAGLSGWTQVRGTSSVITYGSANVPGTAVARHIGGGGSLLLDQSGSSIVEQVVSIGSPSAGTNLRAGGYFGAFNNDESRLVVRFLDATNTEIARENLAWSTEARRNRESVLLLHERILTIPSGTARVAARIEFNDLCCSARGGAADELFLELVQTPLIPPPKPFRSELLGNPRFEAGWAAGSPLSLNDLQGWEGRGAGVVRVVPYSDTNPSVPSSAVSCLIGGGLPGSSCLPGGAGNLATHDGGSAAIAQRIDLRGNDAQIRAGQVFVHLESFLGGVGGYDDTAQVDVRFLDETGTVIAPASPLGPVTRIARNEETLVVRRVGDYFVPPRTAFVDVVLSFSDTCCSGYFALADNISAQLIAPVGVPPIPLGVNLISNGSFERGSLPGSPLDLNDPGGWFGAQLSRTRVQSYGASGSVPGTGFSGANGLGGAVLGHTGNSWIRQLVDLRGSASLVNLGRLRMAASAWFGGAGSYTDSASMQVRFLNAAGVQVGGAGGLQTLGPVTNSQRNNQTTLQRRNRDFAVPAGAAFAEVTLQFVDNCCSGYFALVDDVRLVAYDIVRGGPDPYPGTNADLVLLTGIDGDPPTRGLGESIKQAAPGSTLELQVVSPLGSYDYQPLLVMAKVELTGSLPSPPPPGFPAGLLWDPLAGQILINGLGCSGFGCAVVLPGGSRINFALPAVLSGYSVFLQGVAVPLPGGPVPANGVFDTTGGHEIRV